MRLTPRDKSILQTLGQVPFLSGQEIEQLFFAPSSGKPRPRASSQRLLRLRLLRTNGFLVCPPRADSRRPFLYALTRRGAAAAADQPPHWVKRGPWPASLTHYRLIARFYAAFARAVQDKSGFTLLDYRGEYALRQEYDRLPDPFGGARLIPVVPDGAALVRREADGGRQFFFLEADTGTETLKRIERKVRGYEAWRRGVGEEAFRKRFNANPAFGVIFVAVTPQRSESLRRAVQEGLLQVQSRPRAANYYFLTTKDLDTTHVLHPRSAAGEYRSLLPPVGR